MAFTICTNQFHFPKNRRKGLKLVSTMALKKWNTNFPFEHSDWTNKTTFPNVPLLLLEIFRWNDPWSRDPFTFQKLKLKTAGTKYMLSSEDSFEIKSLSTAEHYFFRIGWSLIQSTGPFLPRANKCIFQTTTLFLRTPMVHFVR